MDSACSRRVAARPRRGVDRAHPARTGRRDGERPSRAAAARARSPPTCRPWSTRPSSAAPPSRAPRARSPGSTRPGSPRRDPRAAAAEVARDLHGVGDGVDRGRRCPRRPCSRPPVGVLGVVAGFGALLALLAVVGTVVTHRRAPAFPRPPARSGSSRERQRVPGSPSSSPPCSAAVVAGTVGGGATVADGRRTVRDRDRPGCGRTWSPPTPDLVSPWSLAVPVVDRARHGRHRARRCPPIPPGRRRGRPTVSGRHALHRPALLRSSGRGVAARRVLGAHRAPLVAVAVVTLVAALLGGSALPVLAALATAGTRADVGRAAVGQRDLAGDLRPVRRRRIASVGATGLRRTRPGPRRRAPVDAPRTPLRHRGGRCVRGDAVPRPRRRTVPGSRRRSPLTSDRAVADLVRWSAGRAPRADVRPVHDRGRRLPVGAGRRRLAARQRPDDRRWCDGAPSSSACTSRSTRPTRRGRTSRPPCARRRTSTTTGGVSRIGTAFTAPGSYGAVASRRAHHAGACLVPGATRRGQRPGSPGAWSTPRDGS